MGCALVFPQFLETCRAHTKQLTTLDVAKFEVFEKQCLAQDSLALVEYALDLQSQGCTIDLGATALQPTVATGGHRRTQGYLTQWMGSKDKRCSWDEINDYAKDVDTICCGGDGSNCPKHKAPAGKCSPGCAMAIHSFVKQCDKTLQVVMPGAHDMRRAAILQFEKTCVATIDPKFFLAAIMKAKCEYILWSQGCFTCDLCPSYVCM
eukprot:COSAG01_NODE_2083_length_8462_cov_17.020567_6_plen_207_part_00